MSPIKEGETDTQGNLFCPNCMPAPVQPTMANDKCGRCLVMKESMRSGGCERRAKWWRMKTNEMKVVTKDTSSYYISYMAYFSMPVRERNELWCNLDITYSCKHRSPHPLPVSLPCKFLTYIDSWQAYALELSLVYLASLLLFLEKNDDKCIPLNSCVWWEKIWGTSSASK